MIEANFSSFSTESGYDYLYIYDGSSTSASLIGQYSGTTSPGIVTASNSSGALTFRFTSDRNTTSAGWAASITAITPKDYRGFYAWRVKSLSNGLTIQRANGTNVGVNGIINAEEDIKFVTDNAEGNEVEFEALWAQAYVTTCSSNNGLSAAIASSSLNANVGYERNFVVVTGGTQTTEFSNTSQKPVTISGLYPDGSGTMNSSRYLAGYFTANKDTKFENVYMRDEAATAAAYQYTYRLVILINSTTVMYWTGTGWSNSSYQAQTATLLVPQDDDPYSD
jgi:hypothetical protein